MSIIACLSSGLLHLIIIAVEQHHIPGSLILPNLLTILTFFGLLGNLLSLEHNKAKACEALGLRLLQENMLQFNLAEAREEFAEIRESDSEWKVLD